VRTGNLWFALKVLQEWIEILGHIHVYFPNRTVFHIGVYQRCRSNVIDQIVV
jgi:hypothetical protein